MIDTVIMCGQQQDQKDCEKRGIPLSECKLEITGPEDKETADDEWQWLQQQLQQSTADFLIVCGHYPVYSIAEHGPTACLVDQLEPWLLQYNVTAYVAGHVCFYIYVYMYVYKNMCMYMFDHTFEYINVPGQYVNYIVTGGAHECDNSTEHELFKKKKNAVFKNFCEQANIPENSLRFHGCEEGGFVRLHAQDTLSFTFYYGSDTNAQYVTPEFSPRK
ncbi:Ser/Thr protein phosphatase family protein [Reticulomyxa filosa]|uniref:Ser/Thr protein phosphatase family protein n=1 Tax=Reticulomyxa filosa TaxID=46433 RepID=X6MEH6_RETFI|nr:Ser/Thr protein phosphatase family protein [Reticulomyxa filosa]|eukprot:ETO12388.1 Ser/Thr protein phosphatase family protein [Reticulomyxa filosa]